MSISIQEVPKRDYTLNTITSGFIANKSDKEKGIIDIKPKHFLVKNFTFRIDTFDNLENIEEIEKADHEANLVDAIARVANDNGMTTNDIMNLFPAILRMLKSQSDWSK